MDGSTAVPGARLGPSLVEALTDLFQYDPRVSDGCERALAQAVAGRLRSEDVLDAVERIADGYATRTEASPGMYARAALWDVAGAD